LDERHVRRRRATLVLREPSKAWGEKFFLLYSPVWMTMMALVMGLGVTARVGEWGFMAIGVAVALPLVLVPALIRDEAPLGRRWYQTYWFKANLYIAIFNFAANYFGSEYFFDILGMVYDYPMIELNFDSTGDSDYKRAFLASNSLCIRNNLTTTLNNLTPPFPRLSCENVVAEGMHAAQRGGWSGRGGG
jgi:hypothetical protein